MSKAEIILEISEGHYKLHEDVLSCIISKAVECQKISIISIVGRKRSGKSFLLNCLINYLTSDNKETWPQYSRIEFNDGFLSISNSSKPKIEMWSKPFIIEEGINKNAIFFMDSSDVFDYEFGSSSSKIMNDILGLFMYTSSSLFYSVFFDFADQHILQMQNFLENFNYEPCAEEIVYHISCTNQEIIKNGFCYGYEGGNKFIQSKTKDLKLENHFSQINCCLWPNIFQLESKSSHKFIMDEKYKNELSKIVHSQIFNLNTLQLKKICKDPINTKDLISLFCKFVEALNSNSPNILATSLVSKLPLANIASETSVHDFEDLKEKKRFRKVRFSSDYANQKLEKYYNIFCSQYLSCQRKAFKDPNYDSVKTVAEKHIELKLYLLTIYDNYFKADFPEDLYKYYRNTLSVNLEKLKEVIQTDADNYLAKLVPQYEEAVDSAIKLYKIKMNHSIVETLTTESPSNNDFLNINSQSEHKSINLYNMLYSKDRNIILFDKFLSVLKVMLTSKKNEFMFAWKVLKENKLSWNTILKERMFFDSSHLENLNTQFKNNIPIGLKYCDSEIQNFVKDTIRKKFEDIQHRNQYIIDCESTFAKIVITFMNQIFSERLKEKLKSQLFKRSEVNIMFENLLRHSRNILKGLNQLNDTQKFECDKLLRDNSENILLELSQKYFEIVNLTKNNYRRAKEEALKKFSSDMTLYLRSALYIDEEDYETKSLNLHKSAMALFENIATSKFAIKDGYIMNLFSHTLNELKDQIQEEMIKFKLKFEEMISQQLSIAIHFGNFIIAGFYDNQINYILDENGEYKRYNAVAFNQNILFDNNAKAFNDEVLTKKSLNTYFDIKRLFDKHKSQLTTEELYRYPYNFQNNSTKIQENINGIEENFEIETLMSMIILNIISDAEKSTNKIIKRAVFTMPTSYDLRQKNVFKDIGKIAGLTKIEILSEMTALAIGYAYDVERINNQNEFTSIFVILNGYELDIAIINIIGKKIVYKSYINFNIRQLEKTYTAKQSLALFNSSCSIYVNHDHANQMMQNFFKFINEVIILAQIKKEEIQNVIISGQSLMYESIIKTFNKLFNPVKVSRPLDLIAKGSIIYSRIQKDNNLEIFEVTKCQFNILFKSKLALDFKDVLIEKNINLPIVREGNFQPPMLSNLPIELYIRQNNKNVSLYEILNFTKNEIDANCILHKILFSFTNFGEINISSKLISHNGYTKELEWSGNKLGLSEEDINIEKNKLSRLFQKMNSASITFESKQLDQEIEKITKYCNDIDMSLEIEFKNISRIKMKQIKKTVLETRKFLKSGNINIDTISEQYSKLDDTFNFFKS